MPVLKSNDPVYNVNLAYQIAGELFNNPILARLAAAQAILESGLDSRPSKLAVTYSNLFGIKGQGDLGSIAMPTTEYVEGKARACTASFAWNSSVEKSFQQYHDLLSKGTSDNPDRYRNLWSVTDFNNAAELIVTDGYATDPNYTKELIRVDKRYA